MRDWYRRGKHLVSVVRMAPLSLVSRNFVPARAVCRSMDLQRVIAWAQNKLAGFYGATAFTYAVDPEAILQTKLLHSRVSICLA